MSIRKLLANLCLSLVFVLIALAVAEALLRVVMPVPHPTDLRSMVAPDTEFGHRLVPGTSHVIEGTLGDFSTAVSINRHGFRSPEYARRPAPGTYRVALFGDSEVFGLGVDDEDMLNSRMEDLLNRGGVEYEVLNFAMPAIGTIVQGRIFERIALDWEPDAAVFIVTVANDLLDDVAFERSLAAPPTDAPAEPEASPPPLWSRWRQLRLYSFARFRVLPLLPGFLTPPATLFGEIPPSVAAWYANDSLATDFALMLDALSGDKRACDASGTDMYIAAVPARVQFDPPTVRLLRNTMEAGLLGVIESDPDRPQRMLRSTADDLDVPYVPVLEEFRRLADEEGVRLKHPNDGHLNARGTLELARLIAGAIREENERSPRGAPG